MHMNDERAAEGLDHLQAAALEMIAAARAFLDVAEDLVADREKVSEVVAAFVEAGEAALGERLADFARAIWAEIEEDRRVTRVDAVVARGDARLDGESRA